LLEYLRWLCGCCCKDLDWYKRKVAKLERHEKAVEVLTEELDIVKQIKGDRVTDFLAKMSLKRYQRALVANFHRFQIASMSDVETSQEKIAMEVDKENSAALSDE